MPKQLVLICGEFASGKSSSLRNLRNPEGVFYLSSEANKPLPFPDKFKKVTGGLQDPVDALDYFRQVEDMDDVHTIVVDSLDFLMEMYESQHVVTAKDTRAMWGQYQQFFKTIMQEIVTTSNKNWIFLAHIAREQISEMEWRYFVPVKGALKNTSVEAYFSTIVYARKVKIKELEKLNLDPELITITDKDKRIKTKYVFQTDLTEEFVNSGIRAPMGMWNDNQLYIENDVQLLLDHLDKYYNG